MLDIMERLLSEGDYYDYGRVLSYHAPWMFVIGARGLGKTYGAKNWSSVTGLKNAGNSSTSAGRQRNRRIKGRGSRISQSNTRN